jgi:sporulation protein YqfC
VKPVEKKDKARRIEGSLADFFELPRDIVLDLSRLTLIGNRQIYLENHKGIVEYEEGRIKVRTNSGILVINGKNLVIRNLYAAELYVEGDIDSLEIIR